MADLQIAAQQMFEATGSAALRDLVTKHGIADAEATRALMMGGSAYVASLWFSVAQAMGEEGAIEAAHDALDKAIEAFWVQMTAAILLGDDEVS